MKILGVHLSTMSAEVTGLSILLVLVLALGVYLRRRPAKLDVASYERKWKATQKLCATQKTWPLAVINADKLLDQALKARKYKGKTMGERLVSAQHDIKQNEQVWFGHKLRNKLVHEDLKKLKKKEVLDALVGFRAALKDLGALK